MSYTLEISVTIPWMRGKRQDDDGENGDDDIPDIPDEIDTDLSELRGGAFNYGMMIIMQTIIHSLHPVYMIYNFRNLVHQHSASRFFRMYTMLSHNNNMYRTVVIHSVNPFL